MFAAEARCCACDELGRSEAQFAGCLGYEGDLFLGGLYPDPNHEPPPEPQPPRSPGFKVQHTGLEAAAGKAFERLEPRVAGKVSCRALPRNEIRWWCGIELLGEALSGRGKAYS